jgi:HPt (histidine-containing phosphotransfer) domain-containing protein
VTLHETDVAPAAAPFDAADLLDRTCGDRELLAEIIDIFRSDTPPQVAALRVALEAGDVARVERGAHRLRGSLSSLSARPAADAALTLETLARQGSVDRLDDSLFTLEREIDRLTAALTAYRTPPPE